MGDVETESERLRKEVEALRAKVEEQGRQLKKLREASGQERDVKHEADPKHTRPNSSGA